MTLSQQINAEGFLTELEVSGVRLDADTGETVTAIIDAAPELQDPTEILQAKSPIYCRIECLAEEVDSPRSIKRFTESTGRFHKVLRFIPSADSVTYSWLCESQRA